MKLRSVIYGTAITAILVVGLGVTRLMQVEDSREMVELEEIKTIALTPPPEPAPIVQLEKLAEMVEPSSPQLLGEVSLSMEKLALPSAKRPAIPEFAVDFFVDDLAPASLPEVTNAPRKVTLESSRPIESAVEAISLDDLDSAPRLLRQGTYRWPRSAQSDVVHASLQVEINTSGRVRLLEVGALSDPAFDSILPRVIEGCRFSAPTYRGEKVNVRYTWNIQLNKP